MQNTGSNVAGFRIVFKNCNELAQRDVAGGKSPCAPLLKLRNIVTEVNVSQFSIYDAETNLADRFV